MLLPVRKIRSAFILIKESYYWRERRACFGKNDPKSEIFILRRPSPENGIGSDTIIFLGQLKRMSEKYPNAIPVIDMEHYPQGISESTGNVWDRFFEQPNTQGRDLESVSQCAHVILADGRYGGKGEPIPRLDPSSPFGSLAHDGWSELYQKYFRLRPELKERFDQTWAQLFPECAEGARILGVKARGTDYTATKPHNHSIQPTVAQLSDKIDEFLHRRAYTHIFLATEDQTIENALRARYGDLLRTTSRLCVKYFGTDSINSYYHSAGISKEQATLEYLEDIYLLAKCNALITGQNSGVVNILLENNGRFEETYLFDLGHYQ